MGYRWNHKAFGRRPGDVEDGDAVKVCPVALDVLLASGMVEEIKSGRKAKKRRDREDEEGDAA